MALKTLMVCAFSLTMLGCRAEVTSKDWDIGARAAETAYWKAYNERDPKLMKAFLADDVEFYLSKS